MVNVNCEHPLREETDRVGHIESSITSIQSNYQERVKRKANYEASVKQTGDRLGIILF